MSLYSRWAQREHSDVSKAAVTLLAGVVVLGLLPYLVVVIGPRLDRILDLPSLELGVLSYVVGGLLVILGLTFGVWSVASQLTRGRGTPVPLMPTRELLTGGPYRYCRNPMTLGAILAYLGFGAGAGTIMGIALALCFAALLVLYLKLLEERELAERFGEAYLAYRGSVPFIIPRLPRRRP